MTDKAESSESQPATSGCSASLGVTVVCCDAGVVVEGPQWESGWGDHGSKTLIVGDVQEIRVDRNGQLQFGFRIMADGRIIITQYGNLCLQVAVPQNVSLVPARPWTP